MADSNAKTAIIVALLAFTGTVTAAVISNWGFWEPDEPDPHSQTAFPREDPSSVASNTDGNTNGTTHSGDTEVPVVVAPHAPEIQINQRYTLWGENTRQFYLEPGEETTIRGMDLYANVATYPTASCAGPGFVPFTWQIREPYPGGGDLEIRRTLMGGKTEQIGLGSMGRATIGICDDPIFKNNGLEKILIEMRYASAAPTDE